MFIRVIRNVAVAAAVFASFGPGAQAATISVGPYTATTAPFIVPILVTGAVDLASFTFDLNYDANAYRINTACDPFSDTACDFVTGPVTLGPFYAGASLFPSLFNPGFVLLDTSGTQIGQLVGVNGAWQDPGPAPSGDGILAFIEFIGIADTTPATPIIVVGEPTLPPVAVPEPSTVALLFAALGVVPWRRIRRSHRVNRAATKVDRAVHAA